MTLVGKDPICNAAMSRLPLVSPPCTHKTRSYQRIEPSGEASGRWEPSSPRTKERSQERAQQCVQWTKHARGQPGSLASGRGRVHRGSWTPGGAWAAALNVLEVLGSSQPRTTSKCSASLSREKPAGWGRSEGRHGGRLPLASQLLDLLLRGASLAACYVISRRPRLAKAPSRHPIHASAKSPYCSQHVVSR